MDNVISFCDNFFHSKSCQEKKIHKFEKVSGNFRKISQRFSFHTKREKKVILFQKNFQNLKA